jgi:hypothetical protein|tara:strand:- start:498 stop:821 length:324 start_codon:yes stop_codon:yes gene_type:complete
MKHENLKHLFLLHKETKWSAEALRLAIEVIFQRDYYEDLPEPKDRDQWIDHCLLQDDLEDKEKRLDFITEPETVLVANKVREDLKLEEITKKSIQKHNETKLKSIPY